MLLFARLLPGCWQTSDGRIVFFFGGGYSVSATFSQPEVPVQRDAVVTCPLSEIILITYDCQVTLLFLTHVGKGDSYFLYFLCKILH